jgi:hypothetical protein
LARHAGPNSGVGSAQISGSVATARVYLSKAMSCVGMLPLLHHQLCHRVTQPMKLEKSFDWDTQKLLSVSMEEI